jgi:PAS domain S-box-containing protein
MPNLSPAEIRSGLTNIVILSAAAMVSAALLGSLLRIQQIGFQPVMYLQIAIAVCITALYLFRNKLSLDIRAHCISACIFLAGVAGILAFGLAGAGTILMFGACIITSLIIGIRAAAIYGVVGFLLITSQLILASLGELSYSVALGYYLVTPAAWFNNLIVYSYLLTISLLLIQRFSKYLNSLLTKQARHIESQSEQISHAETILEVVVNSLPYGIIWKDKEFRYLGANKFFLNDIKIDSFSEIKGKTDFEIMPEDIAQRFHELDSQVLEKGSLVVNYEERHLDKFGQIKYIAANRVRLSASDGSVLGVLSAYNDITDRIVMEMDLREAKQSAEQANLAKSQFLANMSHEIRTPLNGILGLLDLSLGTELNDSQLSYLRKANLSAKTLLNIINDVLDISKIEAGQMQLERVPFALEKILDHIASQFSLQAQSKNIEFEMVYQGPASVWVLGDPTRLFQVLMNLCSNSVKFTEHGKVVLNCEVQTLGSELAITIAVSDTGIGIEEDVLPLLFSNFTQADSSISRKFGGTGLGLSIVKALVELMDGSIKASSTLGRGSRFEITLHLPLSDAEQIPKLERQDVQLQGRRILLVEDNAINQMIASEMLVAAGAHVECADNGQLGLDLLAREDFDLVLMDIQMPVMDGCTAISHIRAANNWQTLPVIALTANVMAHDIKKYHDLGFSDHLAKPFERKDLLELVANHTQ